MNFFTAYQNAAQAAHRTAQALRLKSKVNEADRKRVARIAADNERVARNAYLATCPNAHEYLNRPTANT